MSQLKESINVYYSTNSLSLELVREVLSLHSYDIVLKKVSPSFSSKSLSIFISKDLEEKYYIRAENYLKQRPSNDKEIFFYYPQVLESNHFFCHDQLSKLKESYSFSGISYSFSFTPKTSTYEYQLLFLNGGRRALFLDRDGVLNVDTGYVGKESNLQVLFDFCPVIKKCNDLGVPVIVLTNQAGVGRGYFSEDDVKSVNEKLRKAFLQKNARIDDFFTSFSHPNGITPYDYDSIYRKPMEGMLAKAVEKFGIDSSLCLMVGDKVSDNFGSSIGRFCLLESKYHQGGQSTKLILEKIFEWLRSF